MKILLPVDGSDYTKRMLSYIAVHDELLGPDHQYTMMTVASYIPARAATFMTRGTIDEYYRDEAEDVLRPVRKYAEQHGWAIREVHVNGHAAEEIAKFAEAEKFDLVVMGSHGHSSLANMVLGSVATGVLARCTVPVLLIR